jgi:hypothetical protein
MILTGSNVATALIKAFGTPKAAARAAGISTTTLHRWQDEDCHPKSENIGKARDAIKVKMDALCQLYDEMNPARARY